MHQPRVLPVHSERDHVRGCTNAPVTLLEYGDYQCTTCRAAHQTVEAIRVRMGSQLRFAFRHLPIAHVHPRAHRAAEAAECAGAQGRFWAMHDVLFEHQQWVGDDDLLLYAVDLRIDPSRFARDLAGGRYARRVREDCMSGAQSRVTVTPTFFVNNVRLAGGLNVESLLVAVERACGTYPSAR
jgi:protein-disulfide isomerase